MKPCYCDRETRNRCAEGFPMGLRCPITAEEEAAKAEEAEEEAARLEEPGWCDACHTSKSKIGDMQTVVDEADDRGFSISWRNLCPSCYKKEQEKRG